MWRGGVQASLTAQEGRSDRVGRTALRSSEAEDTCRDRGGCVEGKQAAVEGGPSDGSIHVLTKTPLHGLELKLLV